MPVVLHFFRKIFATERLHQHFGQRLPFHGCVFQENAEYSILERYIEHGRCIEVAPFKAGDIVKGKTDLSSNEVVIDSPEYVPLDGLVIRVMLEERVDLGVVHCKRGGRCFVCSSLGEV